MVILQAWLKLMVIWPLQDIETRPIYIVLLLEG